MGCKQARTGSKSRGSRVWWARSGPSNVPVAAAGTLPSTRAVGVVSATARTRAVLTVIVALAVASGCSSAVAGRAVPDPSVHRTQPVSTQHTPRPADRKPQAVAAALRQIDPCRVFDLSVAARRHKHVTTEPSGPHACELTPQDLSTGISFQVVSNDQAERYSEAPLVLAGTRAYRTEDTSHGHQCQVDVPVSHVLALRFVYRVDDVHGDACGPLQEYVTGSITKLRDPAAVRWTTSPPIGGWDGCSLLASVLGGAARSYNYSAMGIRDPFSGCSATPRHDLGEPGHGDPGGAAPTSPPSDRVALTIEYNVAPSIGDETRTIAGTTVQIDHESDPRCAVAWSAGPSTGRAAHSLYSHTVVTVLTDGGGCDAAVGLAPRIMTTLQTKPPAARPQQPLLYAPTDNDAGSVGDCVDLGVTGGQTSCEPYRPTQLPRDAAAILTSGNSDPNVGCSVSADAVRQAFGAEFKPVTWGQHCFWVDRTHLVQLLVDVDASNRPSEFGHGSDLWVDRTESTIAGKPVVTFWDATRDEYDIYLSPTGSLSDQGIVHIEVQARGGRGHTVSWGHLHVDPTYVAKAGQVMSSVVTTFFTTS